MKFWIPLPWILIFMGLAAQLFGASSHVEATPESAVWLVGDSTLHPFTERSTQFKISGSLDPQKIAGAPSTPLEAVLQRSALKTFDVVIPVTSLQSKEPAMDKNLDKALDSERCPTISFHLSSYAVLPDTAAAESSHVQMNGTLSIACKERPVTVEAIVSSVPGALHVLGSYPLLMADYGVKPPTMMMGTIRVKNAVTIHFNLQLIAAG